MSLSIPPQGFEAGSNPKTYPIVPPSKQVSSKSGVNTNLTSADVKVNLSNLEIIKIIPEEGTAGSNNISSDGSLVNNETALNVNANSDELVEKIIDPKTGEKVQETSDTNQ